MRLTLGDCRLYFPVLRYLNCSFFHIKTSLPCTCYIITDNSALSTNYLRYYLKGKLKNQLPPEHKKAHERAKTSVEASPMSDITVGQKNKDLFLQ